MLYKDNLNLYPLTSILYHSSLNPHSSESIPHPSSSILHAPTSISYPPFSILYPPSFLRHSPAFILHPPSSTVHTPASILFSPFSILYPPSFMLHSPTFILHPLFFMLQLLFYILHSPSFILRPSCFIPQPSSSIFHPPLFIPHIPFSFLHSQSFIFRPLCFIRQPSCSILHHPSSSHLRFPSFILYPLSIYLYSPWIHYPLSILLSQYAITSYYISFIRFLLRYENFLRKVDCRVTLPYWDWSLFAKGVWRTGIDDIWSNKPWGLGGNGRKKKSHRAGCVKTGRFSQRKWRLTPSAKRGCLKRKFSGTVYIMTAIPFDWLLYSFRRALNY